MRTHPYLRAYMAGVAVPTLMLLVMMTVFATLRFWATATARSAPRHSACARMMTWVTFA